MVFLKKYSFYPPIMSFYWHIFRVQWLMMKNCNKLIFLLAIHSVFVLLLWYTFLRLNPSELAWLSWNIESLFLAAISVQLPRQHGDYSNSSFSTTRSWQPCGQSSGKVSVSSVVDCIVIRLYSLCFPSLFPHKSLPSHSLLKFSLLHEIVPKPNFPR